MQELINFFSSDYGVSEFASSLDNAKMFMDEYVKQLFQNQKITRTERNNVLSDSELFYQQIKPNTYWIDNDRKQANDYLTAMNIAIADRIESNPEIAKVAESAKETSDDVKTYGKQYTGDTKFTLPIWAKIGIALVAYRVLIK
jgi:hypothetical protein